MAKMISMNCGPLLRITESRKVNIQVSKLGNTRSLRLATRVTNVLFSNWLIHYWGWLMLELQYSRKSHGQTFSSSCRTVVTVHLDGRCKDHNHNHNH